MHDPVQSSSATGSYAAIASHQRSQRQSRVAAVLLDIVIAGASIMAAYVIRFEGSIPEVYFRQMAFLVPFFALLRIGSNALFGMYRFVWRYVGLPEALKVLQSILAASAVLLVCRVFLFSHSSYLVFPFGIIVIDAGLSFLLMAGSRFVPRILAESGIQHRRDHLIPTLLVGAGSAGLAMAKELLRNPGLGLRPIGFLDDNPTKSGMAISGIRVLGALRDADRVLHETGAQRIIITSNTIPSNAILKLMTAARPHGANVSIVPGLFEILDKKISAASIREVRIEDILSRVPIEPSLSLEDLRGIYGGKRILVTGAGGSIGSELCRQLVVMNPESLLLLERDETNLFEIERELAKRGMDNPSIPILVDITNERDLEHVFKTYEPNVVFHAAAFKHVPMMERFPYEAVRNNVFGTKSLAELSAAHGVEAFVMISTDKAVNPTSVMGASKRLAEQLIQQMAPEKTTRFSCVRFGNVLGSRGSVVGIFRDQIAKGGPVTVTHPEAVRYFMTIPEAANLVIQAGTLGSTGEVFLLDMGKPVRIMDLARQMIHLSGFSETDVPIEIVGSRPGEKLFEELRTDTENLSSTSLRKVFRCDPGTLDQTLIAHTLETLNFAVRAKDKETVRQCFIDLKIGYPYRPHGSPGRESV